MEWKRVLINFRSFWALLYVPFTTMQGEIQFSWSRKRKGTVSALQLGLLSRLHSRTSDPRNVQNLLGSFVLRHQIWSPWKLCSVLGAVWVSDFVVCVPPHPSPASWSGVQHCTTTMALITSWVPVKCFSSSQSYLWPCRITQLHLRSELTADLSRNQGDMLTEMAHFKSMTVRWNGFYQLLDLLMSICSLDGKTSGKHH